MSRILERYLGHNYTGKTKDSFYQAKYEYYGKICYMAVVLSAFASVSYFVSDCLLFGRFAFETVIPRGIILIELLVFRAIKNQTNNYRVMVPAMYVMLHLVMWNTIWTIYYLPDRTHANEGFIIMHLMFIAVGFCAPFRWAAIAHVLLIVDIIVSYPFNHYENFAIMLALGIPCIVSIIILSGYMERIYVDHYRMTQKLRHVSRYDYLTGAFTRNIMQDITSEEGFKPELGYLIGVLMIDLDHFKKINDTYGHSKGDIVLKAVAEKILAAAGEDDYVIRWGGEEFVVLLQGKTLEESVRIGESIRREIEKTDNGVCGVTVSIGVSKYDGVSYKKAIDDADAMLYQAKENGRNRVQVSYRG